MLKRFLISSVVLLVALLGGYASTLYVSSSGSDSGLGTYESPYQTIAKAVTETTGTNNRIELLSDITQTSAVIFDNKTFTFDGNGHTITGRGFACTNSTVTLKNVTIDGKNYNDGDCSLNGNSFMHFSNSTITLDSGVILTNAYRNWVNSHGVIYIDNYSKCYMKEGCVISNLTSNAGSVRITGNSEFYMEGGEIVNLGNLSTAYTPEGVAVYVNKASFYMSGGIIHNNTRNPKSAPGTVFLHSTADSNFYMSGGEISGNSATKGGAVYSNNGTNTISISGTAVIRNNVGTSLSSQKSSIYLFSGQSIDLSKHLQEGAYLEVFTASAINGTTDALIATGANAQDVKYIHSDIQSVAGIVYCDGTKDITAEGKVVRAHHTCSASTKGNLYLSEAAAHIHSWQYSTSEDKSIVATCVSESHKDACIYENSGVKLTFEPLYKGHIDVELEPHNASALLIWKSENPDVVSVDNDGNLLGLKSGSAVITVTSGDGTKFSDSVTVHVPQ